MSISMKFVPYGVALRNLMGKESYEAWLRSMERSCSTYIEREGELQATVEKAGLDYLCYGALRKTHMGNTFFYWRLHEQTWQAVFSAYDNPTQVHEIMQRLEAAYGKILWQPEHQVYAGESFPTDFTDAEVLKQSLLDCQLKVQETGQGDLLCADERFLLHRQEDGRFTLMAPQTNLAQTFDAFSRVDTVYKQYVQYKTHPTASERESCGSPTGGVCGKKSYHCANRRGA